jgi:hypothetical protein
MEDNNQALRLAQMMQNTVTVYPSYELALPLVEIGRSKLKKLAINDVLLLGLKDLVFVLMENGSICAELAPIMISESSCLEIMNVAKCPIKSNDSKKYQTLKISFGKIQSRNLEVGYRIDITEKSLHNVTLIVEENKYANGFLVNVDGELAVKIEKVENE